MKVFHHNDMDGYAAAHAVKTYKNLTDTDIKNDFIELDHSEKDKDKFDVCSVFEEVWIVDYSFTEKTCHILKTLLDKKCKIRWIDHHASSLNLLKNHPEFAVIPGIIRNGISGAALTYMYCFLKEYDINECPKYIQLVSDYDCWHLKMNPLTDYFKLYFDYREDKWACLDELYENRHSVQFITKCCEIGKIIKSYIDSDNTFYRNAYGYEAEFEGLTVFVVNKDTNSWIFGDLIKKYPMVVNFAFDGENYKYSLYADESFDTDCSKIAEKHGGGGHPGVAGFISKELLFKKKK